MLPDTSGALLENICKTNTTFESNYASTQKTDIINKHNNMTRPDVRQLFFWGQTHMTTTHNTLHLTCWTASHVFPLFWPFSWQKRKRGPPPKQPRKDLGENANGEASSLSGEGSSEVVNPELPARPPALADNSYDPAEVQSLAGGHHNWTGPRAAHRDLSLWAGMVVPSYIAI